MPANYAPDPKMKFTFGLWTVGNPGRDPFGLPTREILNARQICDVLGEAGAYGVNFQDNGLVVPMATTNLFSDPVFKDGAFTSNNAQVRAYAIQKTMRAMDLGVEFG